MAVTIQDLLNDPKFKDNKSLLLLAKPDIGPHKPRKRKTSRLDRIEEKLDSIIGKIEKIESRLDKIESRLDEHDQLFRTHGWIK